MARSTRRGYRITRANAIMFLAFCVLQATDYLSTWYGITYAGKHEHGRGFLLIFGQGVTLDQILVSKIVTVVGLAVIIWYLDHYWSLAMYIVLWIMCLLSVVVCVYNGLILLGPR